jgi:tetratricopeptide (TPR) repeat protein
MKVKVLGLAVFGCALASLAAAQAPPAAPAHDELKATIAALRERLATNPGDAVAHNKLGICYQRQHQWKLAKKEYEKAIDLSAAYAEPWNNLGTLEQGRGKNKKAVAHYRKAIALKPERATFHRNLGTAWLAWGRFPLAIEAFAEAVRLDPANLASLDAAAFTESGVAKGQLYFAYAKVFAARGDFESAFAWLTKAHEAGFHDFGRVAADPEFALVRRDPRYAGLTR